MALFISWNSFHADLSVNISCVFIVPFRSENICIFCENELVSWHFPMICISSSIELLNLGACICMFRYLWRGKHTFAIAQHKHHQSIYEEADANKRRKRYARPLIDLHMKIYRYEGMEPWNPDKGTVSGK